MPSHSQRYRTTKLSPFLYSSCAEVVLARRCDWTCVATVGEVCVVLGLVDNLLGFRVRTLEMAKAE
jgi:hypothetical protein